MHDLTTAPIALSFVSVWVLEKLKGIKSLPFITEHSTGLNRLIGVLMASLSAAGIEWQWNDDGSLLITGLTMLGIGHFAASAITQLVFQESAYFTYQKLADKQKNK